MNSREHILAKIIQNQPSIRPMPDITHLGVVDFEIFERFKTVLHNIGGQAIEVSSFEEIKAYIQQHTDANARVISTLPELSDVAETHWQYDHAANLGNAELAVIRAHFGVAENAALWLTEDLLRERVTPFIPQYLAVVLSKTDIVPTMHHAYARIGSEHYGFGVFVAGPSKTADIEQALVLGAHGARGLTVFLV